MNFSDDVFNIPAISEEALKRIQEKARQAEEERLAESYARDMQACKELALELAKQRKEINKKISKLKKAKNPADFAKIAGKLGYFVRIFGQY